MKMLQIGADFWNIQGSFKIAGLIDIGTHVSLVRRASGRFLFLDGYTLSGEVEREVMALTDDGAAVEAVLHLHPFHTVHVEAMHRAFPGAKHYGTARHVAKAPEVPWEPLRTDEEELHELFADDLAFSVPAGVDLISANEQVHFSSVLALHRASQTLHVDDTLVYVRLPKLARVFGATDVLRFHPTLSQALEPRPGAAEDFRQWAEGLIADWSEVQNLCTAHIGVLTAERNQGAPIPARISAALDATKGTLRAHARRYG